MVDGELVDGKMKIYFISHLPSHLPSHSSQKGLLPSDIGKLCVVSSTGFLGPGLGLEMMTW